MNGKYKHSSNLEGQLAAVAMSVIAKVQSRTNKAGQPEIPSVTDFEEAFRVHVQIQELHTRLDERDKLSKGHANRRSELVRRLYVLMAKRPEEFQF